MENIKFYRPLNEEEVKEINRLATNGIKLLGLQESSNTSEILNRIDAFLRNFDSDDEEELEDKGYELGSLLGNTIVEQYGWQWLYVEADGTFYYGVVSHKERACCMCHNYIYSILQKTHTNNVKLLFNMIKKEYPKNWYFMGLS